MCADADICMMHSNRGALTAHEPVQLLELSPLRLCSPLPARTPLTGRAILSTPPSSLAAPKEAADTPASAALAQALHSSTLRASASAAQRSAWGSITPPLSHGRRTTEALAAVIGSIRQGSPRFRLGDTCLGHTCTHVAIQKGALLYVDHTMPHAPECNSPQKLQVGAALCSTMRARHMQASGSQLPRRLGLQRPCQGTLSYGHQCTECLLCLVPLLMHVAGSERSCLGTKSRCGSQ